MFRRQKSVYVLKYTKVIMINQLFCVGVFVCFCLFFVVVVVGLLFFFFFFFLGGGGSAHLSRRLIGELIV